ncbi:MAG: hypothetical protein P8P74_05440 [Crocinitomicaceae bacterium]|nr:hypothetical protein [Crocinitomicaceae bacterium]
MKKASLTLFVALIGAFSFAQETDSTGLEGDNLDLNGVLELFKESKDVEDFEKKLNTESNGVNNLDLNEDGEVDYIRVVDHADSNAHSLALQVPVNETESQDVAVLEMEEVEEDKVNLQVIGDSELYGEEYMIEPADEKNASIVVNVNTWRPVRHIYGPRYVAWRSPYRWGYYPRWHRPWRRVGWAVYRPRIIRYHRPYYRRTRVRRCHRAHRYYRVHHVHSPFFFKGGKSATTVKAKGGKVGVKKTTTVKKTNNGTVVKKQTTTVKKNPNTKAGKKETTVVKNNPQSTKVKKQTTVKKTQAPKAKKQTTTVQKKSQTKKANSVQRKGTQTKSTKTKRPGATKQKGTTTKSTRKTSTRKGRR